MWTTVILCHLILQRFFENKKLISLDRIKTIVMLTLQYYEQLVYIHTYAITHGFRP